MKVLRLVAFAASAASLVAAQPTPAPSKPTPAPSTPTPEGCWEVSVERDATYCIDGPICSGDGPKPAGTKCPVKGDVAIDDCYDYLPAYAGAGKCVAPVDAECKVIKTGAWGCVWPAGYEPKPTPAASGPKPTPGASKPGASNTPGSNTPGSKTPTPGTTKPTTSKPTTPSSSGSSSGSVGSGSVGGSDIGPPPSGSNATVPTDPEEVGGVEQFSASAQVAAVAQAGSASAAVLVGVIGAVAGVVAVVAAAMLYRRRKAAETETAEDDDVILTPGNDGRLTAALSSGPRTPPVSRV